MYHKHHTRGIVISSRAEDADSKRVEIFTESFGLISGRVQGARSGRSKLRAGAQDFTLSEFSLVLGRSGWRVVSTKPHKNFFEVLRGQPEKLKITGNVLNLIKRLVAEEARLNSQEKQESDKSEEGGIPLFEIVLNFLEFLAESESADGDTPLAEALTIMRVLHSLGYMRSDPELVLPLSSAEIHVSHLESIAPRRAQIVSLINESLKAA